MAESRSWVVREAGPEDDTELLELFRIVFGSSRSADYHQWKFRENPDGPPVIAVAEDKGKIVGQYALWPTKLRLGSEVISGAQSLDTMTHPDYRGQGMFTVLAEECMRYAAARGIEALYGFPNENSRPGFVRRLDWDCTGDIPRWVRPLAISRHRRTPPWIGPLADLATRLFPRGKVRGFDVRMGTPSTDALEALLGQWREQKGLCRVERTPRRYRWRFSSRSGADYRFVGAYRGEQLLALGVWGRNVRSGNALLAELLTLDPSAAEAVLSVITREAAAAACPTMVAANSRVPLVPVLWRCGFIRRRGYPLIVRKLTTRSLGANVHTHTNWDIFGADLDTF